MEKSLIAIITIVATLAITPVKNAFSRSKETGNLSTAQVQFGHNLFAQILKQNENTEKNIFVSTPSVFYALSMTIAGADKTTRSQLLKGLQLDTVFHEYTGDNSTLNLNLLHLANKKSLNALEKTEGITLNLANAIWVDELFPLKKDFPKLLKDFYNAKASNVSFKTSPAQAAKFINNWAKQATQERILEVINEQSARELSMLLANAIYFKGNWHTKFKAKKTISKKDFFVLSNGNKMDAQVMRAIRHIDYYTHPGGGEVIRLPFKGKVANFYIILPPKGANAKSWVAQNASNTRFWSAVLSGINNNREVSLELPKFKFATSEMLKNVLLALGIKDMFSQKRANFSQLSKEKSWVSFVKQDAFLQVDETGAEAAAITTVGFGRESVSPAPIQFHVNRPFAIAIRHEEQGVFLFQGLVEQPVWQ